MTDVLATVKEFWGTILMVGTGIGSFVAWLTKRNKAKKAEQDAAKTAERVELEKKEETAKMMFEELENFKQKLILKVVKEYEQTSIIAEKNQIIADFKLACPDCYERFASKYNLDGSSEGK